MSSVTNDKRAVASRSTTEEKLGVFHGVDWSMKRERYFLEQVLSGFRIKRLNAAQPNGAYPNVAQDVRFTPDVLILEEVLCGE